MNKKPRRFNKKEATLARKKVAVLFRETPTPLLFRLLLIHVRVMGLEKKTREALLCIYGTPRATEKKQLFSQRDRLVSKCHRTLISLTLARVSDYSDTMEVIPVTVKSRDL